MLNIIKFSVLIMRERRAERARRWRLAVTGEQKLLVKFGPKLVSLN